MLTKLKCCVLYVRPPFLALETSTAQKYIFICIKTTVIQKYRNWQRHVGNVCPVGLNISTLHSTCMTSKGFLPKRQSSYSCVCLDVRQLCHYGTEHSSIKRVKVKWTHAASRVVVLRDVALLRPEFVQLVWVPLLRFIARGLFLLTVFVRGLQ
jgi:hypothetical protein